MNIMKWVQVHGKLELACWETVTLFALNSLSVSLTPVPEVRYAAKPRARHSLRAVGTISLQVSAAGALFPPLQHTSHAQMRR